MSKFNAFLLACALIFLPTSAMAEISLADMVDIDTSLTLDESLTLDADSDANIARGRVHHVRRGYVAPVRHTRVVRHQHVNVRPRYVHRPAVIVEQPATVVVDSTPVTVAPKKIGSTFGFGVRGLGIVPSEFLGDSDKINGGFGYYLKYRPSRWVSLEFINDFIFGRSDDWDESYYRIPVSLGLRFHIFDYGSLDVYGVAAAAVTAVEKNYDRYYLFGGQFGAGISLLAGIFEIGVDVRYTIDDIYDYDLDHKGCVQHGFMFSLNLGFGL